jgi:hypothetical protein
MAAATKYQCILYLFNLFLMGIGACLIWYGVETVGPDWNVLVENLVSAHLWPLSITAGVAVLSLGLLGCCGACRAKKMIARDSCSCQLWIYGMVIFVAVVVVAAVVAFCGVSIVALDNDVSTTYNATTPSTIDTQIMQALAENPESWINLQNSENCCGWGSLDDDLSTGDLCPGVNVNGTATDTMCRNLLITTVTESLYIITAVSAVTLTILLLNLCSVCCLTCCADRKDAFDSPNSEYRKMDGGSYARGAGYV